MVYLKPLLEIIVQCWSKETQLWSKNFLYPPWRRGLNFEHSSTYYWQPPSKLIYHFEGAHKKFIDHSCVSFDQHCTMGVSFDRVSSAKFCLTKGPHFKICLVKGSHFGQESVLQKQTNEAPIEKQLTLEFHDLNSGYLSLYKNVHSCYW